MYRHLPVDIDRPQVVQRRYDCDDLLERAAVHLAWHRVQRDRRLHHAYLLERLVTRSEDAPPDRQRDLLRRA